MTATAVMPIPVTTGKAACADPRYLPLVDAAHDRPGGPAAKRMKKELCGPCTVSEACFVWAMTHGESGVWAATSPKARTQHGAPKRRATKTVF